MPKAGPMRAKWRGKVVTIIAWQVRSKYNMWLWLNKYCIVQAVCPLYTTRNHHWNDSISIWTNYCKQYPADIKGQAWISTLLVCDSWLSWVHHSQLIEIYMSNQYSGSYHIQWWASTLSSTHLCHFTTLHTFMPYEHMMSYDTPCKSEVLWLQVTTSCLHHYSCNVAGSSHTTVCMLHQILPSWMNLGLVATHYDCSPSPCQVQCVSFAASLSGLLLYSLIVVHSTDPRLLSNRLVWCPWTLSSYKKHVSTFNLTEEFFPRLHL